jgi:hypothetical protein
MLAPLSHPQQIAANTVIRQMHNLVTYGPWDLDVASAMSAQGYDEVKWADGQVILAELIASEIPPRSILLAAQTWYEEASVAARWALAGQPKLLGKLGLA